MAAVLNKRDRDASEILLRMLKVMEQKGIKAFGVASTAKVDVKKRLEDLDHVCSPVMLGHVHSRVMDSDKPQPMKLRDVNLVLDGRIYSPTIDFLHTGFPKQISDRGTRSLDSLVRDSEGSFAFAAALEHGLIVGRDAMGLCPCYYGENSDLAAVASQRKALWNVGLEEAHSFPPGHIALVNKNGFSLRPVRTLVQPSVKETSLQDGANNMLRLLRQSIEVRLAGLEEVALAFSGGVDSSIIAVLAKKLGVEIHLICVSLKGEQEAKHAERVAADLKVPLQLAYYDPEDVEHVLPSVMRLIEDSDPVAVSIGVPFFWASEVASDMGLRIMLTGQGADELFGGYKRYADHYMTYGAEFVRKTLLNDVLMLSSVNLERDSKIGCFHNIELRLPFVNYRLAEYALSLPLALKIESVHDRLRKRVLRRMATDAGLPRYVAEKSKKAIQYASGVSKVVKRLARKKSLSTKEFLRSEFNMLFGVELR